ncbi:MAG: hypothetical protein LBB63_04060 [Holosporaceae bacterium]|jgi:hypothetical protein|nr:hypothetical protein [Holosporaceae bacterium]
MKKIIPLIALCAAFGEQTASMAAGGRRAFVDYTPDEFVFNKFTNQSATITREFLQSGWNSCCGCTVLDVLLCILHWNTKPDDEIFATFEEITKKDDILSMEIQILIKVTLLKGCIGWASLAKNFHSAYGRDWLNLLKREEWLRPPETPSSSR